MANVPGLRSPYVMVGRLGLTMFDYLDFDEGRDPVAAQVWLKS